MADNLNIWSVTADDLIAIGRNPGGDRFTDIMDTIIRGYAASSGMKQSDLRTNLRTNLGDKGVDTEVMTYPSKDTIGWMGAPTIWQYKATDEISDKELEKEVNKEYAKECIEKGYAYRFCICTEITADKKTAQEDELLNYVRKINPKAPVPRILGAGDIAAWAGTLPAVVSRFFRQSLTTYGLHLNAWKNSITAETPEYIRIEKWQPVSDILSQHITFSVTPSSPVISVQGEAGVGKTRTVFEAIAADNGMLGLVIYVENDERAIELANVLSNDSRLRCILVVDECRIAQRLLLEQVLRGHKDRVRVICIDNAGERQISGSPIPALEHMSEDETQAVLAANFIHVPEDRRRSYGYLSSGYIRLAADMCRHDSEIAMTGSIDPAAYTIESYVRTRVPSVHLRAVYALALFAKVGFKFEPKDELVSFCSLLPEFKPEDISTAATDLHNSPGFIAKAGAYLYITPPVVANLAFRQAYSDWVADDPRVFFSSLPPSLMEAFLERVKRSATKEVRAEVSAYFREWASSLKPNDLASFRVVHLLTTLVDTYPDEYLPLIKRLVVSSTTDELLMITSDWTGEEWGPRRQLVWLFERLSSFPEYFSDCEVALRELAIAENEQSIGNNATHTWTQLFLPALSGTAVPYSERIERLKSYVKGSSDATALLAILAAAKATSDHITRMSGPFVVAGRIPPKEWRPRNNNELRACLAEAINVIGNAISEAANEGVRSKAITTLVDDGFSLLRRGFLFELKSILLYDRLDVGGRTALLREIDQFVELTKDDTHIPDTYRNEVMEWRQSMAPQDLFGQIVELVSADPWEYSVRDEDKTKLAKLKQIATVLQTNRNLLFEQIQWLQSSAAKSAAVLGNEIGKLNEHGALLHDVINSAVQGNSSTFARGYLLGYISRQDADLIGVNSLVDTIEATAPMIAFELIRFGGRKVDSLERSIRLVDDGRLPAEFLRTFDNGIDDLPLTNTEKFDIITRLLSASGQDIKLLSSIVEMIGYWLDDRSRDKDSLLADPKLVDTVWTTLEQSHDLAVGTATHWWFEALKTMSSLDSKRATALALSAMLSDNILMSHSAIDTLVEFAQTSPDLVADALLEAAGNPDNHWRFYLASLRPLIQTFPTDIITNWIDHMSPEIAWQLARHVPPPYIGAGDLPILPKVTERLLSHFEDNDRVFQEFVSGVHNMQMYDGDIAASHDHEAYVASKFLDHPLRRVREWAQIEMRCAKEEAKEWRRREEEDRLLRGD